MKRKAPFPFFLAALFIMLSNASFAQITFPALIGNNMVLQQNQKVQFWGWCKPGKIVTIVPSWNNQKVSAITPANGEWRLTLQTPSAGGPHSIRINDSVFENVMIGEVWLCSGQSNMQMTVCEAKDPDKETKEASYPSIRFFTVSRQFSETPKKDCYGRWLVCTPETTGEFSAVGYFFGRELNRELMVPVGLINASWGGTPAESWTRHEVLESNQDLSVFLERFRTKARKPVTGICPFDQNSPSALYNGMIAPLIPYSIRGVIWYQGESNTDEPARYEKLFPAMIGNWRTDWDAGNFPFYYVQIAPYNYDVPLCAALLRDAQRKSLSLENTGMAVTLDIGNPDDIHPLNKQDVGRRLALIALARDYGRTDITYSGPLYSSMEIEKSRIRLNFSFASNGLVTLNGSAGNFEIADDNRIFVPAVAEISGNSVIVSAPQVKSPVAVRYAFHNADTAGLFNHEGLPASSFRTDDWPVNIERTGIFAIMDTATKEIGITMKTWLNPIEIRYTDDGYEPNRHSELYKVPFSLKKSARLRSCAFMDETASTFIDSLDIDYHLALGKKPVLSYPYSPKYKAAGQFALTDGIRGSGNFRDGNWQGFLSQDLDAVIDLEKARKIGKVSAGFLQSINDWIFFPVSVEVSVSSNGRDFESRGILVPDPSLLDKPILKKDFSFDLNGTKARYIRVTAVSLKAIPSGHPGQGSKAWMFADEIVVE